jgi:hypothetical protein
VKSLSELTLMSYLASVVSIIQLKESNHTMMLTATHSEFGVPKKNIGVNKHVIIIDLEGFFAIKRNSRNLLATQRREVC